MSKLTLTHLGEVYYMDSGMEIAVIPHITTFSVIGLKIPVSSENPNYYLTRSLHTLLQVSAICNHPDFAENAETPEGEEAAAIPQRVIYEEMFAEDAPVVSSHMIQNDPMFTALDENQQKWVLGNVQTIHKNMVAIERLRMSTLEDLNPIPGMPTEKQYTEAEHHTFINKRVQAISKFFTEKAEAVIPLSRLGDYLESANSIPNFYMGTSAEIKSKVLSIVNTTFEIS